MTPQRWRQIEDLYHAALEQEPAVRTAFLAEVAPVDSELRAEVESLLAQTTSGTTLITNSITTSINQAGPLAPGTRLGPYRIEAAIGQGGMGDVYRAMDTRLHRTVAIKTLPHDRLADPERKRRFMQEARAASALNHPNIVTLYDIANDIANNAGIDYLVMEYVAGKSLDKLVAPGGMPLAVVIDYATQMAGALATAHAAGIVHRDIKPANAMVTPDGQIKVLDFGLAKLEDQRAGPADETRTMAPALTLAGMVMGTVAYMSPEQARGLEVDARTDLFSFGAVLYEMAAGRRAFQTPLDWTQPPVDPIPVELRPIVLKLLEADRNLRYQHASEVRADLRRLKRDSDSASSGARPRPPGLRWAMIAAAAVVLAIGAGYSFLRGAPKLTDKDTIVLADFRNSTGDPVFDETLRQGLAVQLEQSPFLSLISDQHIRQTLPLMGQPPDARITSELAEQICERSASAAVLEGTIDSLGSGYVVGLSARRCRTGDILDREQVQAARKEDVLNSLSQIATKIRSKVGESLASVKLHATPLMEATTPSLEALKAYSEAQKVLHSAGDQAALPFLKRAVGIDPKFAIAYAYLGRVYGDIGEPDLSAETNAKAWQLRDRASDAEKFFIDASYYQQVTGNLGKAQETFELWGKDYPRAYEPPGLLSGAIYPVFGKHEQAIEQAKKAIALDPDVPFAYVNLATSYQFLERYPEAEAVYQQATGLKVEIPDMLVQRYDLGFLKGDQAEMDRQVALSQGKRGAQDWTFYHEALVLAYSGHLRQARSLSEQAVNMARQAAQTERAGVFEAGATFREALFGNDPAAKRGAAESLKLSKDRDVEYGAAVSLAIAGDSASAQRLGNDLEKRFPEDTSVQISYLPVLRALFALNRGESSKAVEALQVNTPYELGVPMSWFNGSFGGFYPVYVRGEAYLAAHQGAEAVAEFRKIPDHRGIVANDPIGALAHLQLGRAFVLSGDKTKAQAAYRDFLTLWKDADPDIPVFRQAKEEYARLQPAVK